MKEPQRRPHLCPRGTATSHAYSPVAQGGGGEKSPKYPTRDRDQHGDALRAQLALLATRASKLSLTRQTAGVDADGTTISVEVAVNPDFQPQSLEDARAGIELLTLQQGSNGFAVATVHVPDGALAVPIKKVDQYLNPTKDGATGPKNAPLIASIERFRAPRARDLWADTQHAFPTDGVAAHWWEVWLRDVDVDRFAHQASHLGVDVGPQALHFPGRRIVIVQSTVDAIERAVELLNVIAELRAAPPLDAEFHHLRGDEQREWVLDAAERVAAPVPDDVAICILDTGVAWRHALLRPAIDSNDCLAYAHWTPADRHSHGTEMAGLACYGDELGDVLAGSGPFQIPFRLESVKVLTGQDEEQRLRLRGEILQSAVALIEYSQPTRRRVFSFAITGAPCRCGVPTAWSAALDEVCSGDPDELGRLVFVSAGNHLLQPTYVYPEDNLAAEVEDPAQSWNAITVGAVTDRTVFDNGPCGRYPGWAPVAPAGDLSPHATTSRNWETTTWPNKPDLVMEGGNLALPPQSSSTSSDLAAAQQVDQLELLTTGRPALLKPPLSTASGTSAATTLAARMGAAIMRAYPELWPETVRALMISSCRWTTAMHARCAETNGRKHVADLMATFGYGQPDKRRALRSAANALTLIVEDTIQPYKLEKSGKANELRLHRIPWPDSALEAIGDADVRLRVTLSYFIEPGPGERGWRHRYRYPSHGLRFAVRTAEEDDTEFLKRINKLAREEGEKNFKSDSSEWLIGEDYRSRGSIHSDVWTGSAARLVGRGLIAVYPVIGWWRERKHLGQVERKARYALVVTVETDEVEVSIDGAVVPVDLYAEVQQKIEAATAVDVGT